MCYSAQIRADYTKFVRRYGATIDIKDFYRLYWLRRQDGKAKVPRALDAAFLDDPATAELHPLIHAHAAAEATRLEQELFTQRARLVKAERVLATKPTKKAADGSVRKAASSARGTLVLPSFSRSQYRWKKSLRSISAPYRRTNFT